MTSRVMLISPAVSAALREARFDDGCSLDAAGLRRAQSAAGTLPMADRVFASPSVRCRETAAGLGLEAVPLPDVAGWAVGRWRGRTLEEVTAAEPEAIAAWLTDPGCAPHGGESLQELCDRVGGWLDAVAGEAGRLIAVVEPEAVRAAAVRALGATAQAFWRIDVPPLTALEFSGRAGRWNLRAGRPLGESV
ncbi:histidine phosphatase family protein [Streptomyces iakyrus]|uniref:histidine phosphatase family protein n=1 Tax=Streptomyces iakyrus TaxID=68219 RepID=UPI00052648A4|nr:histidine phosphatase family protein [Streptomyces iakyrus]